MKLRDVFVIGDNIERVYVHPTKDASITVYIEGNNCKTLREYVVLDPYINSSVSSIFVHSESLSIHLEDTSSESGDHEDEMPELSNISECMNEFFDYAESCGVGALL